ncbi:hypothetical protein K502DRAFT_323991 [Neoconidiobolus thromboides FSU 785]|nr:hypothetical protein K502DRAFT_323991 [Neoconidiobolus thromboides FSU 785]
MLNLPSFRSNSVQPQNTSATTANQANNHPNIPTVSSVASIFKFQKLKLSKSDSIPKLNESHPLSLYFFAEEHLSDAIKHLEKVKSVCSRRFHRYTERVHLSQKLLLDTIYLIYSDMDEELKISKAHRTNLPLEDQIELNQGFSENILFAAQAIVHGFHIRGIEHCSEELKVPALQLCAALEALRHVFRLRALEKPEPPYNCLYPVLSDFDQAWATFERDICQSYFSAMQVQNELDRPENFELFSLILKENIKLSIKEEILDKELIEEFDPSVIFAIPRLSLLSCFLQRDKPLLGIREGESVYPWFESYNSTIKELDKSLFNICPYNIKVLKNWLATSTPPPLLKKELIEELQPIFNQICQVADSLQSGPHSKQFLSALNIAFNDESDLMTTSSQTSSSSSLTL